MSDSSGLCSGAVYVFVCVCAYRSISVHRLIKIFTALNWRAESRVSVILQQRFPEKSCRFEETHTVRETLGCSLGCCISLADAQFNKWSVLSDSSSVSLCVSEQILEKQSIKLTWWRLGNSLLRLTLIGRSQTDRHWLADKTVNSFILCCEEYKVLIVLIYFIFNLLCI